MSTILASRADALHAIDVACDSCERDIDLEGDCRFDRGIQARIAFGCGAVHIDNGDSFRLMIDDVIEFTESDDPRELLIGYLEAMVAKLANGGR